MKKSEPLDLEFKTILEIIRNPNAGDYTKAYAIENYIKQRIKSTCEFYLRYKDKPELLKKEHSEFKEEVEKFIIKKHPILQNIFDYTAFNLREYNEWLFKLAFKSVFKEEENEKEKPLDLTNHAPQILREFFKKKKGESTYTATDLYEVLEMSEMKFKEKIKSAIEKLLEAIEEKFIDFEQEHMRIRIVEKNYEPQVHFIRKDYIKVTEEEWDAFRKEVLELIKKWFANVFENERE